MGWILCNFEGHVGHLDTETNNVIFYKYCYKNISRAIKVLKNIKADQGTYDGIIHRGKHIIKCNENEMYYSNHYWYTKNEFKVIFDILQYQC